MMPSPGPNRDSDSLPASASLGDFEQYPTLKQSLSASLASNFHYSPSKSDDFEKSPNNVLPPPGFNRGSPTSLHRAASKAQPTADVALTAWKYLPTPVLVLSSSKTVVLASEAMGHILPSFSTRQEDGIEHGGNRELSISEELCGKSLSEIGVGVIEDGHPILVSWDRYLDGITGDTDDPLPEKGEPPPHLSPEPLGQPDTPISPLKADVQDFSPRNGKSRHNSSPRKRHLKPRNLAVDVVLTSRFRAIQGVSHGFYLSDKQINAKMHVSTWYLDKNRYYTLSFTPNPSTPDIANSPRPRKSSQITRPSLIPASIQTRPNQISARSSSDSQSNGTNAASPAANPLRDLSPLASPTSQLGSPFSADGTTEPTMSEKLSRMKDAILSSMQIPVFAMWKDESLVYPNEAGVRMMRGTLYGPQDEPQVEEPHFTCWTEDFERELREDEYPITQLCRSQDPTQKWRIGVKDPRRGNVIFDVTGEGIYDEKNGEFIAGMITMKDVTDYLGRIKLQSEENEQQFQLICDTMPQLVCWNTLVFRWRLQADIVD